MPVAICNQAENSVLKKLKSPGAFYRIRAGRYRWLTPLTGEATLRGFPPDVKLHACAHMMQGQGEERAGQCWFRLQGGLRLQASGYMGWERGRIQQRCTSLCHTLRNEAQVLVQLLE